MRSYGNRNENEHYIACPNCNKQMGILAHYCNECGSPLPPPAKPVGSKEQVNADAEICGETGHVLQTLFTITEAKFCLICGKSI